MTRARTPRNRVASVAAQADREAIRTVLATRTQAEPLFTAKEIVRLLGSPDSRLCTVRRHLRAIRAPR